MKPILDHPGARRRNARHQRNAIRRRDADRGVELSVRSDGLGAQAAGDLRLPARPLQAVPLLRRVRQGLATGLHPREARPPARGARQSLLRTIGRGDGRLQVTYRGRPLLLRARRRRRGSLPQRRPPRWPVVGDRRRRQASSIERPSAALCALMQRSSLVKHIGRGYVRGAGPLTILGDGMRALLAVGFTLLLAGSAEARQRSYTYVPVGTFGWGGLSVASDINADGAVAGHAGTAGVAKAMRWHDGRMTNLGSLTSAVRASGTGSMTR